MEFQTSDRSRFIGSVRSAMGPPQSTSLSLSMSLGSTLPCQFDLFPVLSLALHDSPSFQPHCSSEKKTEEVRRENKERRREKESEEEK